MESDATVVSSKVRASTAWQPTPHVASPSPELSFAKLAGHLQLVPYRPAQTATPMGLAVASAALQPPGLQACAKNWMRPNSLMVNVTQI